jgi:hypothetical protein
MECEKTLKIIRKREMRRTRNRRTGRTRINKEDKKYRM